MPQFCPPLGKVAFTRGALIASHAGRQGASS